MSNQREHAIHTSQRRRMEQITVALFISATGFQPVEYQNTRTALEAAGIRVIIASDNRNAMGNAIATDGSVVHVDYLISNLQDDHCAGLALIGGGGALDHLDSNDVIEATQRAIAAKKVVGAICIAPRILAKAGILTGKRATGWDGDNKLAEIFEAHAVKLNTKKAVVADGNIVTAQGPAAATEFGETLAKLLLKKKK